MFNKIETGILLINNELGRDVSCNSHFTIMAEGKEQALLDGILKYIVEQKEQRIRSDIEFPDGSCISYAVYGTPSGSYIVFLNDISQKKIYIESKEEGLFYDRLLSFIAEVVHEVGNPLTIISTTLQVLLGSLSSWDDTKKGQYIERAINEIDRLCNYLDRMRDFSTVVRPEKRSFNLKTLIEKIVSQNTAMFESKAISVQCFIDNNIEIFIDDDIFYQIMLNLLLNSVDAVPEQRGKICIEVENVSKLFVKIFFKNNGPPISDDLREKIFMPFFSTKKKGRGIGLALSLKRMILMGGSMKVEPPEGEWGAKFALYLPVPGSVEPAE
ncbi:MAG: HAMP domain-containing histidine kinase [Candidatus Aminicenantes bacterium]|nr:HAMP domain-containing histidine kinase [Candidatus Aminicenantes bacterium]